MKRIEIVSHCLATDYPHYADALCYQLSSLVLHPPKKCRIRISLCIGLGDKRTDQVINYFMALGEFDLSATTMRPESVGRRSIGRNLLAKRSKADIVWFADVDQCFRDGILDRLAELEWPEGARMIYPKQIKIHRDHVTGDHATSKIDGKPRVVDIDPSEFIDKRYRKAIGGVQIVQGNFAREWGYLSGHEKWQTPAEKPFGDFRDDIAYRNFCREMGGVVGVELNGLYRIRHTQCSYQ